ncbi:MAG TPA: FAD-binding oxidoreductase [Bordetella sp.]
MRNNANLPESVDVAVIGGGIIGICTAYALAKAGVSTAVFEKGLLACEQSSRNWGWVRTLNRDMPEVPVSMRSNEIWDEIQAQAEVGFRRRGILYLQENADDAERHQRWLDQARDHYGFQGRLLGQAETRKRLPPSRRNWTGALYSDLDGVAEPQLATQGIAGLVRRLGGQVFERCAVRGIEQSAGRVSAVVTEHGRVRASTVVLAGGAWSRLFCGNLGVEFPQLKVRGSVLRTSPVEGGPESAINGKDFTCRKRADGGYTVSQFGASMADITPDSFRLMGKFFKAWMANNTFVKVRFGKRFFEELAIPRTFGIEAITPYERNRVLDPTPSASGVQQAWSRLVHAFPAFESARIAQSWAGYIDATPDAMPVMAQVRSVPGFYLASGFSGHGFGFGPGAGEFMAGLIQGKPLHGDAHAFRLDRY